MKQKYPNFSFERKALQKGYQYIIGIDEVGRGSFAGPLVTAAVVFSSNYFSQKGNLSLNCAQKLLIVDDSKKVREKDRLLLSREIKKIALAWDITQVSVGVINRIGIADATLKCMRKTISDIIKKIGELEEKDIQISPLKNPKISLLPNPNKTPKYYCLVDYFSIPYLPKFGAKNQKGIKKGDQRSISISAASIIAKVYRDELMTRLSKNKNYQKYHWDKNKGYGTAKHREVIKQYGLTKHHRKLFVRKLIKI